MYGCKPDGKKKLSLMPGYSGRMTAKEELELLTRMKFDNDNVNKFTALLEAIPYVWLQTRRKKNKQNKTNKSIVNAWLQWNSDWERRTGVVNKDEI